MKTMFPPVCTGLKGFVEVSVVDHAGKVVRSYPKQRNLILNAGLDKLATVSIADMFLVAVKGTDTDAMKETVVGTYTLNTGTLRVTRNTGARNFTSADLNHLIRSADSKECLITNIVSTTVVDVVQVGRLGLTAFTTQSIVIYSVQKTGLTTEQSRTSTYGQLTTENETATVANARTYKRTFVFPAEPGNLTLAAGTAGWSGTTVTGATGHVFTTADIGAYLNFTTTSEPCQITGYTSGTVVTVDRSPAAPLVGASYDLYGVNEYTHIGFSDSETPSDPLNVLVRLESAGTPTPVRAVAPNPEFPGQQVKVTYTLVATFGPVGASGTVAAAITDTGTVMSSNKNGTFVLEGMSASSVSLNGDTDLTYTGLDPFSPASCALSPSSAALVALGGTQPDRSSGAASVAMASTGYTAGYFEQTFEAIFGPSEAVATNWRTMGIYDDLLNSMLFTFLFAVNQSKPGTHQLTLRWKKSWNRDLS